MERYESDEEDEREEGDQILLTLSDQFLEEKDTNGMVCTVLTMYAHVHMCNVHVRVYMHVHVHVVVT